MEQEHKYGFTLGKFMPPHRGHLSLIEFASAHAEHVTILVCTLKSEPIPGQLRAQWMRELFPQHTIIHVTDEVPSYPEDHPDFWNIWRGLLKQYIHPETSIFFSGEPYGDEVARQLNINHICLDRFGQSFAISATAVRKNPFGNWYMIPENVRPYFVKRVVLTGPESTGKTLMARRLAEHFQTNWVEEYGREHFEKVHGNLTLDDISIIAQRQIELEDESAKKSNKLLFCDTDLIVTQVWSEIYFDECPDWIVKENHERQYDLFLLMDIDVPWVDDGTREFPHLREKHFNRLKLEMEQRKLPFKIISGSFEQRIERSIQEVGKLLVLILYTTILL